MYLRHVPSARNNPSAEKKKAKRRGGNVHVRHGDKYKPREENRFNFSDCYRPRMFSRAARRTPVHTGSIPFYWFRLKTVKTQRIYTYTYVTYIRMHRRGVVSSRRRCHATRVYTHCTHTRRFVTRPSGFPDKPL